MTEFEFPMDLSGEDAIDPETIGRIKPCPFCGRQPEALPSGNRGAGLMIHCITDGCVNPSVSYYNREFTLNVWNRRAK